MEQPVEHSRQLLELIVHNLAMEDKWDDGAYALVISVPTRGALACKESITAPCDVNFELLSRPSTRRYKLS